MDERHITRDVVRRLRDERTRRGVHQQYVADRMGIAQNSISRWEHEHVLPTLENLIHWADALDLDLTIVFTKRSDDTCPPST